MGQGEEASAQRTCPGEGIFFKISADRLGAVSAADIACVKPPYIHFRRQYFEYIFYYILEGELHITEDAHTYHLQENDFILLDPSRCHAGIRSSACRFFYAHFAHDCEETGVWSDPPKGQMVLPKYHHIETTEHALRSRELVKLLVQDFGRQKPYGRQLAGCLLQELLLNAAASYEVLLHRQNPPVHGKMGRVIPELIEYLDQNYAKDISGAGLAGRYHYHFDYLNRQFAKWTGKTIFAYLNEVRIQRAEQLLTAGFYTIEETALQTGFRDVYYFSRVFKKYTGMTPGQMKKGQ